MVGTAALGEVVGLEVEGEAVNTGGVGGVAEEELGVRGGREPQHTVYHCADSRERKLSSERERERSDRERRE